MNNYRNTYRLLSLLSLLMLFSCSQDDLPGDSGGADDPGIVFCVSMPDAMSRSNETTITDNLYDGFHVSAFCPEDDASAGNTLREYFIEQFAAQSEDRAGYFGILDQSSEQWLWPTTRHGKLGKLKFFAFYPSRELMRQKAGVESGYFGLTNKSTKTGSTVNYDYRMEKFKVNKEITRHFDFVTATAEGSRRANGESGVKLDFEHQLSRISLKAWGKTVNDIEIVGVRIGCAVTESGFNFAAKPTNLAQGDNTVNGNWIAPQVRDYVEYIFREGDVVVKVGNGNLTSESAAASIMGTGGWAMVIPADNAGWNHTRDAANASKGLYFSVLMRVKGNDINNSLLYPYVKGGHLSATVMTDAMTVIYLSIEQSTGKVMKRLYRDEAGSYFTDPAFTTAYVKPATEEIRNYGWAAIPLSTTLRWKPGYQYTYMLNYTNGVGVHDPNDPYPGKPIISTVLVSVTESGKTWPVVYDFTNGDAVDVTDQITIK